MDNKIVIAKVKFLKKCIFDLSDFVKYDYDRFMASSKNIAAAKFQLYAAIQTVIYLAAHSVYKNKLEKGVNYSDLFEILCKNGKLSPEYLDKYLNFLKIRDSIVLEYDAMDDEYIYHFMIEHLADFTIFLKDIKRRG